jgi:uncharacterized protein (DUF433 family)
MASASSVIIIDPETMSGAPVFRGTRVPVRNLFHYLESGKTLNDFLAHFPSVTQAQAIAVLEMADRLVAQSSAS